MIVHLFVPFFCSYIEHDRVCGFWTWLFVLSKLPELGDTIFIVLRKQPLIFLHWYHHITVLMYSWFSYTEYTASARWFVVMNYCVHSLMYTYYALRALKFNPPRFISMVITGLQLTQMIVGCAINVWAYDFLQQKGHAACNISSANIKLSIAMYASYFILFARFFHLTYLSTNARKGKKLATSATISQQPRHLDSKIKAQ
jgi:elongation of very long chain fatty acids protein 6